MLLTGKCMAIPCTALALALALAPCPPAMAQEPDLFELSLEALRDIPFSTASRQLQTAREAPAVISVITAEDIRQFGYRSVAEALAQAPGMYAVSDGVSPNVGVRGINAGSRAWSRILKVMIDGQPLAFRADASNFLGPSLINMEAIERIEVVRGPASALYGADAFLGVVNIITRPGDQRGQVATVSVAGGAEQGGALALQAAGQHGAWQWLASAAASGMARDGQQLPRSSPLYARAVAAARGDTSAGDGERPRNLLLRVGHEGEASETTLLLHAYRLDAHVDFLDFGVLSHNNRLALHQQTARLQHEHRFGDWTVRASAADTRGGPDRREHLSLGAAASYPARGYGFAEQALGLEVQRRFGERHSLLAGADHSHDTEQRMRIYSVDAASGLRTAVSGGGADAHFNNLGYYLQYRLQPWSWLGVTANVRRDRHNVFGSDQNYRLALVGNATPSLSYKLLHGTSYKAPSAAQLYARPLYSGDVLGNLALRPETSASSEASVAWQATPALSLSANVYKLAVRDLTELLPLGGNVQPQNSGRQRGHGWEGEAYWQFGVQRLRAQLSWADTDDYLQPRLQPVQVTPTASYPRLVARLSWQYLHAQWGQLAVSARHVSPRRASKINSRENFLRPYQLPAYTLADLNWQRSFGPHGVSLRVANLFDRRYAEPGYGGVDLPGLGRSVALSYSYRYWQGGVR